MPTRRHACKDTRVGTIPLRPSGHRVVEGDTDTFSGTEARSSATQAGLTARRQSAIARSPVGYTGNQIASPTKARNTSPT